MNYQKIEYRLVRESNPTYKNRTVRTSAEVVAFFADLQTATREKFYTVCLDPKNRIACVDLVSIGANDKVGIDVKEVLRAAIMSNATAIITVHNHPSGEPSPSMADKSITIAIKQACNLFQLQYLDHIIIGDNKFYSFADEHNIL